MHSCVEHEKSFITDGPDPLQAPIRLLAVLMITSQSLFSLVRMIQYNLNDKYRLLWAV